MRITIYVLIIDSSSVNRKAISDIINSSSKLKVIATAANADFALKKLKQDPDVILLGLEKETIKEISLIQKKQNINNKIPVIILSSNKDLAINALLQGADDFIIKIDSKLDKIKDKIIDLLTIYGNKSIKNKIITNINSKPETYIPSQNEKDKKNNLNIINIREHNLKKQTLNT
ncbi:Protein-glutamate methylesterase [Borrelia duttonii CR2A]|uniref:Protein-glutamate methylesterase n=1 Tax=Borrelia duttonii CR2A TaxID=1432657 RepID=W6TIR4_9SPIR|nr:response regulator [Borrelia duttonii]ETZ18518.1 Protein-glutamate methylesterase [Borrelia duttonii CR2A]